jgi:hypothetical protein
MGTKVMVRATRSFNGRVEGDWYWVDPDDPHEGALIRGGYYAHQEDLLEELPAEAPAKGPEVIVMEGTTWKALEEAEAFQSQPFKREDPNGEVAAEPGEHHQDGAGPGQGAGDPDGGTGAGRSEEDRPE